MTIDEAIEILTNMANIPSSAITWREVNAIKLGAEALKRERLYRENNPELHFRLLLGESKD